MNGASHCNSQIAEDLGAIYSTSIAKGAFWFFFFLLIYFFKLIFFFCKYVGVWCGLPVDPHVYIHVCVLCVGLKLTQVSSSIALHLVFEAESLSVPGDGQFPLI